MAVLKICIYSSSFVHWVYRAVLLDQNSYSPTTMDKITRKIQMNCFQWRMGWNKLPCCQSISLETIKIVCMGNGIILNMLLLLAFPQEQFKTIRFIGKQIFLKHLGGVWQYLTKASLYLSVVKSNYVIHAKVSYLYSQFLLWDLKLSRKDYSIPKRIY